MAQNQTMSTGNDTIGNPFQPKPTGEHWDEIDNILNREGAVVRTGLYLRDRAKNTENFGVLASNIKGEIDDRINADSGLDNRITTLESELADADAWRQPLADEVTARTLADTRIANDLATETSVRIAKDTQMDTAIATESSARSAGDITNADAIKAEVAARVNADVINANSITNLANSLGTASKKDTGSDAGDVVTLGSNGKIDSAFLPSVSVSLTHVVSTEAEMLALNAGVGEIAVRSDTGDSFILQSLPATTLANWVKFGAAGTGVTSFNGQTGIVTYTAPVTKVNGKTGDVSFTVNSQAYGADGNVSIDGTKILVDSSSDTTVAEALDNKQNKAEADTTTMALARQISELQRQVTNLQSFITKMATNLHDSGAMAQAPADLFPATGNGVATVFSGHIAYGNINVYGSQQDAANAIFTSKTSPDHSIAVGA